jgi:hypothetical protein
MADIAAETAVFADIDAKAIGRLFTVTARLLRIAAA